MNGRVYDPTIGRFLSPDPLVQAPLNTQSYNRYSYVWNNPLSFTDPTGFSVTGGCAFTPYVPCEYSNEDGNSSGSNTSDDLKYSGDGWVTVGTMTIGDVGPNGNEVASVTVQMLGKISATGNGGISSFTTVRGLGSFVSLGESSSFGEFTSFNGFNFNSVGNFGSFYGFGGINSFSSNVNFQGVAQRNNTEYINWGEAGLGASAVGVALPYADGSFGITSKGEFRFYKNNWRGNQYITTRLTHAADVARPLGPVGFALSTFADVSSARNGDIPKSTATINTVGGFIGLFYPSVGLATAINSLYGEDIGGAIIDTAVKAGPNPELPAPNSGLELQRALNYAFEN